MFVLITRRAEFHGLARGYLLAMSTLGVIMAVASAALVQLADRLLADAKLKPEERWTWSTVYPGGEGEPRPAGLLGRVKLVAGTDYIELSN